MKGRERERGEGGLNNASVEDPEGACRHGQVAVREGHVENDSRVSCLPFLS